MVVYGLNLPTGPEVGGLLVAPKHIIVDLLLVKCMPTSALWLTLTACLAGSLTAWLTTWLLTAWPTAWLIEVPFIAARVTILIHICS